MTKKIYYEKRGRRYVPVMEHDYELMDAMPRGNHLNSHPAIITLTQCTKAMNKTTLTRIN